MTVNDVLTAMSPFDTGFTAICGVLIASYLVRSVLRWFAYGVKERV